VIDFAHTTLGILAGGRATRLNGADKALLEFQGVPLLQRTLLAFPEAYDQRLLSHNRAANTERLAGLRVIADRRADFPGPLAALEALTAACATPWLLTVPVDCRCIPPSLASELIAAAGPDGAVVSDIDGLQPLVALWRVAALTPAIAEAFSNGDLAAHRLVAKLRMQIHDISPHHLGNLNTPADFLPS
jgi:molybdopterin-guanine dinucleotide biosynthesis protein A